MDLVTTRGHPYRASNPRELVKLLYGMTLFGLRSESPLNRHPLSLRYLPEIGEIWKHATATDKDGFGDCEDLSIYSAVYWGKTQPIVPAICRLGNDPISRVLHATCIVSPSIHPQIKQFCVRYPTIFPVLPPGYLIFDCSFLCGMPIPSNTPGLIIPSYIPTREKNGLIYYDR